MNYISLYTKKLELKFNDQSVSVFDPEELINEISKEYVLLDTNPSVAIEDNFLYVRFKVGKKKESKALGFEFGKR
ncbi:MAG: hypothetical protein K2X86_11385 [Cytophagaceae bacterium]|nr:hypothetical protein [Cytophagaceae bacterium]